MKKYCSFFRMRFSTGLQYRAAALGGIITQFMWGVMEILLYRAFYQADAASFPMSIESLTSYIWLQQAFLALYMIWFLENDIFETITSGNIVYELCRPIDIYQMWFTRSVATRLSKAVLRCMPILCIAVFIPKPYGIHMPVSLPALLLSIVSMFLSLLVVVAFSMILYICAFYTISPLGIKLLSFSLVDFCSGSVLPLPFLPDSIRWFFEILPFASMQNVPFRIYGGDITGKECAYRMGLQVAWFLILFMIGKVFAKSAMKKVVCQGG
jgi:ABC-2 type transport system permease protein